MNISQVVEFPGVSPEQLFRAYSDPETHRAATREVAEVTYTKASDGEHFRVRFVDGNETRGRVLLHDREGLRFVQTWWSNPFDQARESVLVLTVKKTEIGSQLSLTQNDVPDRVGHFVEEYWYHFYWASWKQHFHEEAITPPDALAGLR
jgi:hypothetical protein